MCLKSYYIYVMHGFSGTKHITLYGQCCLLALCDMHVTLLGSGRWDKQYVRQVWWPDAFRIHAIVISGMNDIRQRGLLIEFNSEITITIS